MAGYSYDRKGNRIRVEIPSHAVGISHSDGRYSRGKITSQRTHLTMHLDSTARAEEDEEESEDTPESD